MNNKLIELERELRKQMPHLGLQDINHGQRHTGKRQLSPYRPTYARAKDFEGDNFEGQAENDDPHILEFFFAGSGYEAWPSHLDIKYSKGYLYGEYEKIRGDKKINVNNQQRNMKGEPITGMDPKQKVYERRKTPKKIAISYGGPLAMGGSSDSGPNSTHNNLKHAMKYMGKHCALLIENQSITTNNPLQVNIESHSRGAATASDFADLMKTIYGNFVRLTVVLHDPVPGPQSYRPYEINLSGIHDTTWILPVDAGYGNFGFRPQIVNGASRLLVSISPQKHSTGLTRFLRFQNNEVTGTSFAALNRGLFYVNENNEIIRVANRNDWNALWKRTLYKKSSSYEYRTTIVPNAVDTFLNDGNKTPYLVDVNADIDEVPPEWVWSDEL